MNCDELRKDIEAIKLSRSDMQEKYDYMNKTGTGGRADFIESRITTEKRIDEILEKYLLDFGEKNPEFFNWHPNQEIELDREAIFSINNNGDGRIIVGQPYAITEVSITKDKQYEIKSFDAGKEWGITATPLIHVLTTFSTNKVVLGDGYKKEISICEKDTTGKWNLIKTIKGLKNEEGKNCSPRVAIEFQNESILVGGEDGMLNICGRDLLGRWKVLKRISGLRDKKGVLGGVGAFCSLSDDKILIGGDRIIYQYSKNKDNNTWELSDEREKVFGDDRDHYVEDITPMPNGNILICTDRAIYEIKYNNNDEYEQKGVYKGGSWGIMKDKRNEYFEKALPISNSNIVVLSKNSAYGTSSLYEFKKNDNGEWSIAQEIGYFDKEKDEDGDVVADEEIRGIVTCANGRFIIAKRGSLVEYARRPSSVKEVKNHLDKIIEKGEV